MSRLSEGEAEAEEEEAGLKNGAVAGRLAAPPAQWPAILGGTTSLAARMLANAIAASKH